MAGVAGAHRARCGAASADARVAVEYSPVHERAGSIRMYETLPYFSGRSTLEGVYNQAATTTHPVYYLASELFARSPEPVSQPQLLALRSRRARSSGCGSSTSPQIVAVSPELASALDARPTWCARRSMPPYTLYRLQDPGPGYVEPLAFAPVRAAPASGATPRYRWFSRKPANRALLVFTDDPRFELALDDPWGPPPERPLPGGVVVTARVEAESCGSPRAVPATRCWSRSPTTRAGAPRARMARTSSRPG